MTKLLAWLVGNLVGWKGYAIAAGLAGVVAGGAAWTAQGWRLGAQMAGLERDQARADVTVMRAAISQTEADIQRMASAAASAVGTAPALTSFIGSISKALQNANPLPVGCKPDPLRVRALTDAVRAANRAAIGQPVGDAMR